MAQTIIVGVQAATFVALGVLFVATGDWRLGASQLMLAAVQGLIYAP